jgi:hypothetical protein
LPILFGPAVGFNVVCHSEVRSRNDTERVVEACCATVWTVMTPRSSEKAMSFKRVPPSSSYLDESSRRMVAGSK